MEGFANLETDAETQESFKGLPQLCPQISIRATRILAFSVKVAMMYDSGENKNLPVATIPKP